MHALALFIIFKFMNELVVILIICYDFCPKVFCSCITSAISRIMLWNLYYDHNCEHTFLFTTMIPVLLSSYLSNIFILNGSNYLNWHEQLLIILGCLDLNLVLRKPQSDPPTPTTSSDQKKLYEK